MSYSVKYLITARQDRKNISAYLNQYSMTAANRLFNNIKGKMELVKENPYMYERYERRPSFRRMTVDGYLVFYKVNEDERAVEVHHILHGMMDIERKLK